MKKISIIVTTFFCGLLVGCTNPDRSRATLMKAGYTDIEITGYSSFACGEGDSYSTGFVATNPQGRRISGTVCCGWSFGMKDSCTIRF